jgi:hypothetical protein
VYEAPPRRLEIDDQLIQIKTLVHEGWV